MSTIIEQLRSGDESGLRSIYRDHRDEFVGWIQQKFRLSSEDAKELFQLSVVTFYDNVMTGKLQALTGTAKTYIFAIGKNKARDLKRRGSKVQLSMEAFLYDRPEDDVADAKQNLEGIYGQVETALRTLGDSCRQLLTLFYYQRMNMESICQRMDYNNAATAKNMKYKCLQRLRKMVTAQPA